jgi:RimJ/RimL family protein N-acetyltransferase
MGNQVERSVRVSGALHTIHAVTLRDGSTIHLRLLRPEDLEKLREGFNRLSRQSKLYRFLSSPGNLTESQLRYLTEIDHVHHLAWCAYIDDEGEESGIGVARYVRLEESPQVAEFAITVADEFQNRGVGRALLDRLIHSAREKGVERFAGYLLRDNAAMLHILEAFPCRRTDAGGNVLLVEFPI